MDELFHAIPLVDNLAKSGCPTCVSRRELLVLALHNLRIASSDLESTLCALYFSNIHLLIYDFFYKQCSILTSAWLLFRILRHFLLQTAFIFPSQVVTDQMLK